MWNVSTVLCNLKCFKVIFKDVYEGLMGVLWMFKGLFDLKVSSQLPKYKVGLFFIPQRKNSVTVVLSVLPSSTNMSNLSLTM